MLRLFVLRFASSHSTYTYIILHGYAICYVSFFLLYISHKNIKNNERSKHQFTSMLCMFTQSHTVHITCIFIYYYVQVNIHQLFPHTSMTAITLQITHNGSL